MKQDTTTTYLGGALALLALAAILLPSPAGATGLERHALSGDLGYTLPVEGAQERGRDFDIAVRNVLRDRFEATVEDFEVRSVRVGSLGGYHARVRQTLHGLPVAGAELVVSTDSLGGITRVNGELVRGDEARRPVAEMDGRLALRRALAEAGIRGRKPAGQPELTYVVQGGEVRLAWSARVAYEDRQGPHRDRVFADAADGSLIAAWPEIHYAKVLRTYDANNGTSLPGTLVCSSTTCSSGDVAIDSAHNYAGSTYDYYNVKFGRDSLNNAGLTLTSTAHYGNNYNNAFWNGSQMVYGDGDGSQFIELSRALDVVAHELTHGVTDYESDLVYANESGALNEALSDIFGAATEAWLDGGVSADTWLLGEDIYTPGTAGDALRYMDDPTADGYSADYYPERLYPGTCVPTQANDQCGVHGNSGIANLAFVLLVDGGSHPRGKTSINVTAIGLAKAEQIFYRAQTTCLTSGSNFEAIRNCTAQAATDLYGSVEESRVQDAWDAVGVPGGGGSGGELQNGVPVTGLSGATGSQVFYTIDVPAGATDLSISISGGTGDADLYVKFGSAPTTSSWDCRPYKNGNNETCTFASPSTGTYHVMLRGYTSYSGVTLVASYTEPGGGGCSGSGSASNLSASTGQQLNYYYDVPACASTLTISISGGSGDADLYVKFGSAPTTSSWHCRPYLYGNNESCTFTPPQTGRYYIMIRAYSSFSGVNLVAEHE